MWLKADCLCDINVSHASKSSAEAHISHAAALAPKQHKGSGSLLESSTSIQKVVCYTYLPVSAISAL
jgi:hypothetical protein